MRSIKVRTARGEKNFPIQTRTLKSGTRLYRWIPEHDETWRNYNNHDHIGTMVFGELRNCTLGGGLYVSENPFDWFGYARADKLIIIELTEDVQILDLATMMHHLAGEAMSVKDFANLLNRDHRSTLLDTYRAIGYEHSVSHKGELTLIGCKIGGRVIQTVSNNPHFDDFAFRDYDWLRARDHTSRLRAVHQVLTKIFDIHINDDRNPRRALMQQLECTDLYDLLKCRSFGEEFERSWRDATRVDASVDDLTLLKNLYRAVRKEDFRCRSHDVIAGGGLEKDGTVATVDTTDGQRFLLATESQYRLISSGGNLFIQLTSDTGEITNSARWFGSGEKLAKYAVRYKYPGLHNFERLARDYPTLRELNPEYHRLTAALRAASFDPSEMTSSKQRELQANEGLNKAYHSFIENMISKLLTAVLAEKISISQKYQKLMSLHPFPDGNGRILRAFFRHRTGGAPLFMPSWDFDIFYSAMDFEEIVFRGIIDFYRITHALMHNPRITRLTELEELWLYAGRSCLFEIAEADIDPAKVRAAIRDADPRLFEKKLVLLVQWAISSKLSTGTLAVGAAAGGAGAGAGASMGRAAGGAGAGAAAMPTRPAKHEIEGLIYQSVPGDGHCLFNAIALHTEQTQASLRNVIAAHIQHNLTEFQPYIEANNPGKTVAEYLEALRRGDAWADNLEIVVLMRLLNRPIVVIGPHGEVRNSADLEGYTGEPIFVYYNGRDHYDAYLLKEGWHERSRQILNSLLLSSARSRSTTAGLPASTHPSPLRETARITASTAAIPAISAAVGSAARAPAPATLFQPAPPPAPAPAARPAVSTAVGSAATAPAPAALFQPAPAPAPAARPATTEETGILATIARWLGL